jgi:hypothetical protein
MKLSRPEEIKEEGTFEEGEEQSVLTAAVFKGIITAYIFKGILLPIEKLRGEEKQ